MNYALKLDPASVLIYHDRISLYIKLRKFETALADCSRSIQQEPDEWVHYRFRSDVYRAMGNHGAADRDYEESLRLSACIKR
jgi:tetratricopeptide (TPR) repeat protein